MRLCKIRFLVVVLTCMAIAGVAGCPQIGGGGDGGGGGGGEQNANGGGASGGLIDNGLEAPRPLPDGVENFPPTGETRFPVEGGTVAAGPVVFVWAAGDANGTTVDTTIVISAQPEVFENRLYTLTVRTAPEEEEHRIEIELVGTGTFYWGIEITDGVNTVLRPAGQVGVSFEITSDSGRIGLEDAILLCPGSTQPARERTTFKWSLGDVEPVRTTVFVSRAGVENPFESPLQVLEVDPPTETFRALSESEALSIGDELSWGLRIETADEVQFTFEGQLGEMFVVEENVPPSGALQGPENDTRLPDNALLELMWADDAGNCEDVLTLTLALEFLGGAAEPAALFESELQLTAQADRVEAELFPQLLDLDLQAGRWAWGILADDGTDQRSLPDVDNLDRDFRTFIRDTSPFFVIEPAATTRVCPSAAHAADVIAFSYDDGNGSETVGVTLYYAALGADVFDSPTETFAFEPGAFGQSASDAYVFVQPAGSADCPEFSNKLGFYGVELDDGVNDPVRAMARYEEVTPPPGACCALDGSCSEVSASACGDGFYQGDGTSCAETECIAQGACCAADGSCTDGPQTACTDGFYVGDGTSCAFTLCIPLGACCALDGTCSEVAEADCADAGGIYQGNATTCDAAACVPRGACCANDGSCTDGPGADCTAGLYAGDGTTCADTTCVPRGACCLGSGACLESEAANCFGTYRGDGTSCATVSCPQPPPPTGACCLYAGGCSVGTAAACVNGVYQGNNTTCGEPGRQQVFCFLDCNSNGVEDWVDVGQGISFDCNNNWVPDECEGNPVAVDAGTLGPGVIGTNGIYDADWDNNYLNGDFCPFPDGFPEGWTVLWTIDSVPPGAPVPTVVFESASNLFCWYRITNALPGDYVFRLTTFLNGVPNISDTVTLTLTASGGQ
ncbi:MAG TPA: hypothetical protein VM243_21125 [Phycisphaerae bacterium]|nr:hypothetical protein [Phycisphaerae bacterium]